MTTGPGCDGVLTESDAHEVPCPHSETSRPARVSLTMRRIAPRRLSRLMNSRRTRRSAASLSAVPPSPLAEAAPSATRLMPMLVPSPNSTSSSRRRSVSGSVTCREATEVNSAVNPVTWSASLIRLSRSMIKKTACHHREVRLPAGLAGPGGDLLEQLGGSLQPLGRPADLPGVSGGGAGQVAGPASCTTGPHREAKAASRAGRAGRPGSSWSRLIARRPCCGDYAGRPGSGRAGHRFIVGEEPGQHRAAGAASRILDQRPVRRPPPRARARAGRPRRRCWSRVPSARPQPGPSRRTARRAAQQCRAASIAGPADPQPTAPLAPASLNPRPGTRHKHASPRA